MNTKNKILIVVPSKARPESFVAKTYSWLKTSRFPFVVAVEPQDYESYRKSVPEANLTLLEANDKGLWFAKQHLKDYALKRGYEYVFKADDDVACWYGQNRKKSLDSTMTFDNGTFDCISALDKHKEVLAIGFPYSHNMFDARPKKWSGINGRLQSCYVIRTKEWDIDPQLDVFEDFYTFLTIMAKNKNTLRYGWMGMECDVGKLKGGIQALPFDRNEKGRIALERMRLIYPDLKVKKVEGKGWELEPDLRGKFFDGKGL